MECKRSEDFWPMMFNQSQDRLRLQNHKIAVYESFFNQIYLNYAVCLDQSKVKEALELIYKFCAQPNYATDEELAEKKIRVIKMMEEWR